MRLLIVGKLHGYIGTASKIALSRGAHVVHIDTIEGALETLRSGKGIDLIMIDVVLDIHALNTALKLERFNIPIIGCGVGTDSASAVQAIHAGAQEYLPLPPNVELIAAVLETVTNTDQTFIARDPSMQKIVRLADQIAPSEASVLITGSSGTGKEVMARYIHRQSRRRHMPFISINCAAIPENLLESELFGHEKGAFTGAIARRIGKFEEASGGTLLLDEITEMHPLLQAKLLRAIQEREIDRVGGSKPIKVDIRILATSNRHMEQAVREGNFREDLYFRLNVVSLKLPDLNDRPLDVEYLAEYFLQKYAQLNQLPLRTLTTESRAVLHRHNWRGNIRELENIMHRVILLATRETIDVELLQLSGIQVQPENSSQNHKDGLKNNLVGRTVADVERDLIIGTLSHCFGNRTQAAHILGISIRTLRNKLKNYSEGSESTMDYGHAVGSTGY